MWVPDARHVLLRSNTDALDSGGVVSAENVTSACAMCYEAHA
jgi:hypothetical protein